MKIAAVQMVSSPSVSANLAAARALLAQAADAGAELAVLPEYFCLLGFKDTDKLAIAEFDAEGGSAGGSSGAPLQAFLSQCARDFSLWIVGGTIPLHALGADHASKVFNSTLVYNPIGERVVRYDKIHLFCFDNGKESYDESRVLMAGRQPVAFDLSSRSGDSWRIGLSICYDLRFPELYRALAADVLLVPSAFTYTTGLAHWELLLRARAIENLAYVIASAQGGWHDNGRRTWGQSMVVGPWGNILAQLPPEPPEPSGPGRPGLVLADLDKPTLLALREQLPALSHRCL